MGRPSTYAPEVRERAVRLVQEHSSEYPSQWAAISHRGKSGARRKFCGGGRARPSVTRAGDRGARPMNASSGVESICR
jgi:hypothetical protein